MSALEYIEWQITSRDCDMCATADSEGWWGFGGNTHCRNCHRTWKMATKQAHCTVCCAHFSSPSAFDLHLRALDDPIPCQDPGTVRNKKTGAYLLSQREDGMWVRPQDERWYGLDETEDDEAELVDPPGELS